MLLTQLLKSDISYVELQIFGNLNHCRKNFILQLHFSYQNWYNQTIICYWFRALQLLVKSTVSVKQLMNRIIQTKKVVKVKPDQCRYILTLEGDQFPAESSFLSSLFKRKLANQCFFFIQNQVNYMCTTFSAKTTCIYTDLLRIQSKRHWSLI